MPVSWTHFEKSNLIHEENIRTYAGGFLSIQAIIGYLR
jgi:hypothetical protein